MDQGIIAELIDAGSDGEARSLFLRLLGAIDRANIALFKSEIDRVQRSDPTIALKAAEVALSLTTSVEDPACSALSWWAKANALRELGEYTTALSSYDTAAHLFADGGHSVDVANTRIGKIDALIRLSRYDEATQEAAKARRLFLMHQELLQAAKLDANMGNLFHRIDSYHPALRRYNRARKVFFRLGEDAMVAQVDVNRANVFTLLDRFSPAHKAYRRARTVFERRGSRSVVAMIDANTGFLFHQRGRYDKALELYMSSADAFRELGITKNAAVVELDLAQIYLDINMPTESIALCNSILPHFEHLGMRAELARTLAIMALAQVKTGDRNGALGLLGEARSIWELEGNEVHIASLDLHRASLLLRVEGDSSWLDEALRLAGRAAETFRSLGIPGKSGLSSLIVGQIHSRQGLANQAAESYADALGTATRFNLPWLSFQALHCQGRLLEETEPQEARELYEQAIQIIEGMRGELRSESARNFFMGDKLQVYQDLTLLLLKGDDRSAKEAFQCVERAKSRALVDLLRGELEVWARGKTDLSLLKRIQALQEELNWYYSRLDDGDAKGGHRLSSQRLEYLVSEVRNRETQLAQCVEQLQLSGPEYSGLCGVTTLSLEDVQGMLEDDVVLVEYYSAGREILCFVITRDSFHVQRSVSNLDTISNLSRRLAFQLSKFNYGERYVADHLHHLLAGANECLARLYDELLRPIEAFLEDRKVVFVPHGDLHGLPFHAFHDGNQYLIQRHEISYAPSATVLRLCANKRPTGFKSCLLVGVSDEKAPQVEAEIDAISRCFRTPQTLLGQEATVKALREHSGSCDVVHIASHALFSSGNPMFSRLKLSDGWLNVYDMYDLCLNASLVTLSSCQTGVSRIVGGDEVIGISRGFLYAGAASLLSSLWAVDDGSTARLMETFYGSFTQGKSKRESLREAQLQILAEYRHPYYWAPFILIGRTW